MEGLKRQVEDLRLTLGADAFKSLLDFCTAGGVVSRRRAFV